MELFGLADRLDLAIWTSLTDCCLGFKIRRDVGRRDAFASRSGFTSSFEGIVCLGTTYSFSSPPRLRVLRSLRVYLGITY
jgi:hypothetical protein